MLCPTLSMATESVPAVPVQPAGPDSAYRYLSNFRLLDGWGRA